MFRTTFKIAWRNLSKNKVYSFINIGGLAVGMAVALLIGLWIYDELSFNRYHKNYNSIVKVMDFQGWQDRKVTNDVLPIPLGTYLQSNYKSDFKNVVLVRETEEHIITAGESKFTQQGNYMQSDAPDMLSLEMIHGSRSGLKDPNSILLSNTLSKKLFGNSDPFGKVVQIDGVTSVKVTGVYKDLPNNSEFYTTSYIAPFDLYRANKNDWGNFNISIFAQLNPNVSITNVNAKIKNILTEQTGNKEFAHHLFLQPMSKWHLYSSFENHVPVTSEQMRFIWFYGMIGVFVLLLACINFMNLSTARSEKRTKEVGIRKVMGSLRLQLIRQFYIESLLMAIAAFIFSLLLVQIILPWFNSVADKEISVLWNNPWFWSASMAFIILTTFLAGSYPALYLSSFNPVKVLKGTFRVGRSMIVPRKALLVVQFTVSIALIIGTIVVYRQIQYAKDRPVGYSQAGLISMQVKDTGFKRKYEVLKSELFRTGAVSEVANANYGVTDTRGWNGGFHWNSKPPIEGQSFNTIFVTRDYGKTVGWQVIQGRDFSDDHPEDSSSIILNESAVKLAGLNDPVGQAVNWEPGWRPAKYYTIVGVVKDMIKGSPYEATFPSVIFPGDGRWLFVKLNPNVRIREAIAKVEAGFKKVLPSLPFDYKFIDEQYGLKFAKEERIGQLAGFFALLAIIISCMGLFGLASYLAEQRTKEIGVRKVLGASVFNVWKLLSKDFVTLVLISCLIAAPLAWKFLNDWLQGYEYRASIPWWSFVVAFVCTLLITLLTISFQAIKAAIANPVKSLRTE
jgi:putative ABC transport system permease protein